MDRPIRSHYHTNDPNPEQGYTYDMELTGDDWEGVVKEFKTISGKMPTDPAEQLEMGIAAVFSSWFTPRAVRYREYNNIPNDLGTAVNIQVWGSIWARTWLHRRW